MLMLVSVESMVMKLIGARLAACTRSSLLMLRFRAVAQGAHTNVWINWFTVQLSATGPVNRCCADEVGSPPAK